MFFEHLLDIFVAWFKSRNWLRLGGLGLLVGCLPLSFLLLVIIGFSTPINAMASRYHELIAEELDAKTAAPASDERRGSERELQIPLRRILQMDRANERVKFFVASELAQQGRTAMAARLMREIAPSDSAGYPDAHAWLAAYKLSHDPNNREHNMLQLEHDLKIAVGRSAKISYQLVLAYAALLAHTNRQEEALVLLRTRREQFPELNVAYAELAGSMNERDDLRDAIRDGTKLLTSRVKSGNSNESDVIQLVKLALLEKEFDKAIFISREAVSKDRNVPVYRLLYSNALLAKYKSLPEETEISQRMQFLDAAFRAYPANDLVVTEVTKAIADGVDMPQQLQTKVTRMLDDGKAPAIAHLLLANSKLSSDDAEAAIVHLELARRELPDSAIVMNNLAMALLKERPEEIDRGAELIEKALSLPTNSVAVRASLLDSQGQFQLAKGDTLGAIASFTAAIQLDESKINTRRLLAKAYQSVEMYDLEASQLRRIKELSEKSAAEK